MNQVEKAARFSELHVKGAPLLLYNAWDAGTAKSILDAGAKAIATSSWAVAEAQGYRDGESIPITFVEQIIARIVSTIDAPVSVDFEGGYSDDNGALAENVARLLGLGIVGINFDQPFGRLNRLIESAAIVQGHTQAMQRILVPGIQFQRLLVHLDGLVEFVVAEGIHRLFEIIFFCHD